MRNDIIKTIREKKIIAIVRGVYGAACEQLAAALHEGGIGLIEVTFDQSRPEAWEQTAQSIAALARRFESRMHVGAGTVTRPEMLRLAQEAGAQFVISPNTDEMIIRGTKQAGLVSIPGAMTPSEIFDAYRYGADFVKVFPASSLGPAYLKAVRGPLNNIPLLAVGGIDETNLRAYLDAGAAGAGVGGKLVNKDWIAAGAFDKITALAREYTRQLQ